MRHDRAIDVEFELALAAGKGDRRLVAEHAGADLGHRLALGRVDLARHDRGSRLVCRQGQFAKPGARAGPQQADIACDLVEASRDRVQCAMCEDQRIVGGQRLEPVRRADKAVPGLLRQLRRHRLAKACRRAQPRAHGRAALRQRKQPRQGQAHPPDPAGDLRAVAGKLLSQGDRRRILKVGPADLDEARPVIRLGRQRIMQARQRGQQLVLDLQHGGDVDRAGDRVVG